MKIVDLKVSADTHRCRHLQDDGSTEYYALEVHVQREGETSGDVLFFRLSEYQYYRFGGNKNVLEVINFIQRAVDSYTSTEKGV